MVSLAAVPPVLDLSTEPGVSSDDSTPSPDSAHAVPAITNHQHHPESASDYTAYRRARIANLSRTALEDLVITLDAALLATRGTGKDTDDLWPSSLDQVDVDANDSDASNDDHDDEDEAEETVMPPPGAPSLDQSSSSALATATAVATAATPVASAAHTSSLAPSASAPKPTAAPAVAITAAYPPFVYPSQAGYPHQPYGYQYPHAPYYPAAPAWYSTAYPHAAYYPPLPHAHISPHPATVARPSPSVATPPVTAATAAASPGSSTPVPPSTSAATTLSPPATSHTPTPGATASASTVGAPVPPSSTPQIPPQASQSSSPPPPPSLSHLHTLTPSTQPAHSPGTQTQSYQALAAAATAASHPTPYLPRPPMGPVSVPPPPPQPDPIASSSAAVASLDLPSYEEMIVEALMAFPPAEGALPRAVFSFMQARWPLQANFRPSASQALQKAYKRGRLEKAGGGKYRLSEKWEGGNTSKRTTRRPQTQSQMQTAQSYNGQLTYGGMYQSTHSHGSPFTTAPLPPRGQSAQLTAQSPHGKLLSSSAGYNTTAATAGASSSTPASTAEKEGQEALAAILAQIDFKSLWTMNGDVDGALKEVAAAAAAATPSTSTTNAAASSSLSHLTGAGAPAATTSSTTSSAMMSRPAVVPSPSQHVHRPHESEERRALRAEMAKVAGLLDGLVKERVREGAAGLGLYGGTNGSFRAVNVSSGAPHGSSAVGVS